MMILVRYPFKELRFNANQHELFVIYYVILFNQKPRLPKQHMSRVKTTVILKFLIPLILTTGLFILLPWDMSKYRIKVTDTKVLGGRERDYYLDLDNDGIVELVKYFPEFITQPSIITIKEGKIVKQWDFPGRVARPSADLVVDWDQNGNTDFIIFTYSNDSLFCNVLAPIDPIQSIQTFFIDTIRLFNDKPDYGVEIAGLYDLNRDGEDELVFSINTAYSLYPRNTYAINLSNGDLKRSRYNSNIFSFPLVDYNKSNGDLLIFGINFAPGNQEIMDHNSDHFLRLTVLDKNLEPAFNPILLDKHPSRAFTRMIHVEDSSYFISLDQYSGVETRSSSLIKLTCEGEILKKIELPWIFSEDCFFYSSVLPQDEACVYLIYDGSSIDRFGPDLEHEKVDLDQPVLWEVNSSLDMDQDGYPEYSFISKDGTKLVIYRSNFTHPASMNIGHVEDIYLLHSFIDEKGQMVITFQNNKNLFFFQYVKNSRRLLILLIMGIFFILIYYSLNFLLKIQKKQILLKSEREQEIINLQLQSLSNKFNPHFTLNLLTSVGNMIYEKAKEESDQLISRYGRILRNSLLHANKFEVSLQHEIENIQDYLYIEKLRNHSELGFSINMNDNLLELKVPKSLILGFVENAVKHGTRRQPDNPTILIHSVEDGNQCIIHIKDNGPGPMNVGSSVIASTKSGFQIADQTTKLFKQITNRSISYSFSPANDDTPETFSEVIIRIQK
jgi:hypothetical protein